MMSAGAAIFFTKGILSHIVHWYPCRFAVFLPKVLDRIVPAGMERNSYVLWGV